MYTRDESYKVRQEIRKIFYKASREYDKYAEQMFHTSDTEEFERLRTFRDKSFEVMMKANSLIDAIEEMTAPF